MVFPKFLRRVLLQILVNLIPQMSNKPIKCKEERSIKVAHIFVQNVKPSCLVLMIFLSISQFSHRSNIPPLTVNILLDQEFKDCFHSLKIVKLEPKLSNKINKLTIKKQRRYHALNFIFRKKSGLLIQKAISEAFSVQRNNAIRKLEYILPLD